MARDQCPTCRSEYPEGRNTVGYHEGDRYRYKPCRDAWHEDNIGAAGADNESRGGVEQ